MMTSSPSVSAFLPPRAEHPRGLIMVKFAIAFAVMKVVSGTAFMAWVSVQLSLSRRAANEMMHLLIVAVLFGAYAVLHLWRRGWKTPRLTLQRDSACHLGESAQAPEVAIKPSFAAWLMAPALLFGLSLMLTFSVVGASRPTQGAGLQLAIAAVCGALAIHFLRTGNRAPLEVGSQGAKVNGKLLRWDEVARIELEPREVMSEYTATRWRFFDSSGRLIGRASVPKMQCSQELENQLIETCVQAMGSNRCFVSCS